VDDLQSSIFDPRSTIHDLQSIISYLDYNGARAFLPVSFFKSSLQSSILNPQSSISSASLGALGGLAVNPNALKKAEEFPCAIAAGPIDADCLTTRALTNRLPNPQTSLP
jgi:hypothetical protein